MYTWDYKELPIARGSDIFDRISGSKNVEMA
jgi:hypothetical protein